jgi:type I restriction enzyme, S subunit
MSERTRLGDAADIVTGNPFKSSGYTDSSGAVRLLRGDNVVQGRIRWDNAKYWPALEVSVYDRYQLRAGDVVLAMDRPWIVAGLKYAELRPDDVPSLLVQRVACLRARNGLDQRYLASLIGSPRFTDYIIGVQTGTAVPHISAQQISNFTFELPDMPTQEAIAKLLGALDDKIATNQKVANVSNDLMKTLYEDAISQGVTTTSIRKAADVFDGPHATPHKTDSGPWFLSISSLKDGRLVLSESAHLSEADFQRWTRRVVPLAGDVLFSYETRLGEAALMPPGVQACLGRRMALLRPRNGEVGPRTLLQAFLSKSFQGLIRQRAIHGATVDRIPLTSLPSWPIDLPADNIRQLEDVLSSIDDVASSCERENERLAELRDTLLPRLMSGEIRVRDAERIVEDAT